MAPPPPPIFLALRLAAIICALILLACLRFTFADDFACFASAFFANCSSLGADKPCKMRSSRLNNSGAMSSAICARLSADTLFMSSLPAPPHKLRAAYTNLAAASRVALSWSSSNACRSDFIIEPWLSTSFTSLLVRDDVTSYMRKSPIMHSLARKSQPLIRICGCSELSASANSSFHDNSLACDAIYTAINAGVTYGKKLGAFSIHCFCIMPRASDECFFHAPLP
mmetsp:Transcript_55699/g.92687  ORF Transcript_55699/g.92687 Transcript_55699/m.92687 type:complete len:226 (-) Transcript_55699:449-1126(-)